MSIFQSLRAARVLAATLLCAPVAQAAVFQLGPVEGRFDSQLSVGASWSTAEADSRFIGANKGGDSLAEVTDDGRLNFRRGELFSSVFKGVHGLSLSYRDTSVLLRGKYWYDATVADGDQRFRPVSDHGRESAARTRGARLLDAYLDQRYSLAGSDGQLRIGRQVLNWGEATFFGGGIGAINPLDVPAFRRPGAELREGLLPVNLIYLSQSLTQGLSLELFHQLRWEPTVMDNCGTFFSAVDVAAPGCDDRFALLATREATYNAAYATALGGGMTPEMAAAQADATLAALMAQGVRWGDPDEGVLLARGRDQRARDEGQFGVALKAWLPALGTELGLYAMTYHSRTPFLSGDVPGAQAYATAAGFGQLAPLVVAANAGYYLEYPEDIRLYGVSFATGLPGGIAWSGEVSHRPNQPLQINTLDIVYAGVKPLGPVFDGVSPLTMTPGQPYRGYQRKAVTQAQTTLVGFTGPMLGAQRMVLAGELAMVHVAGLEDHARIRYGAGPVGAPAAQCDNGTPLINFCGRDGYTTRSAWGYRTRASLEYLDLFAGVNLRPGVAWSHDVRGHGPNGVLTEGNRAAALLLEMDYLNTWQASLSYTDFLDGRYQRNSDRDFVALSIGVNF